MIVPDVNLLVYAYDADSRFHAVAKAWWQGCLSGGETVGLPGVVAFGFVRLVTSARVFTHPMTPAEAAGHVREWLARPGVEWLEPQADHRFAALGTHPRRHGVPVKVVATPVDAEWS